MSQRQFLDRERQGWYDEVVRDAAYQYLAMVEIDADRNDRLKGCLVGLNKRRQEQFVGTCLDVSRWCSTEITANLIPIYTTAGRLYRRYLKRRDNAKIDKLKRQMQHFGHTLALLESIQESAHVVIDAYFDQYDALVTRGLAPELTSEEKKKRSRGPTEIPIDRDRLEKIRRKRHAAQDTAERDTPDSHKRPKSRESLEKAFKSSLKDNAFELAEETTLFDEDKPKKKKKKGKSKKKAKPKSADDDMKELVKEYKAIRKRLKKLKKDKAGE